MEDISLDDITQMTENYISTDLVALIKEIRIKMANELIEKAKEKKKLSSTPL